MPTDEQPGLQSPLSLDNRTSLISGVDKLFLDDLLVVLIYVVPLPIPGI